VTTPRHEAEAIALSLAVGKGVVIRDTRGIAFPVLGRIAEITGEHVLVDADRADGHPVRFERSTGYALLPGDHDRWKLCAPAPPGSEDYGDLLIEQGRLQAQRDRIQGRLDLITAHLDTAEQMTSKESDR
jgi:hypothetical protein